jgi:hypothetical protein
MGELDHFRIQLPDCSYTTLDKYPWYRKDKYGWPIETYKGKPFKSFVKIICQNIRKIIHF